MAKRLSKKWFVAYMTYTDHQEGDWELCMATYDFETANKMHDILFLAGFSAWLTHNQVR